MISHESLKAASLLDPRLDFCCTGLCEVDDMTSPGGQHAELRFGTGQLRYVGDAHPSSPATDHSDDPPFPGDPMSELFQGAALLDAVGEASIAPGQLARRSTVSTWIGIIFQT